MKKFLLSLATAFSFVLFLGSCTNEEDINNNGYSDKEKAKIETLMNLFDSYGWELDTTVSIEQRNKELLEMDYEKTKSFLEYMSNGIEFDSLGNCEVLISGSGQSSKFRVQPDIRGNKDNQRFVMHIIPKPGIIE